MRRLCKLTFISIFFIASCGQQEEHTRFKYEDRVIEFLKHEGVPLDDSYIFFLQQSDCPCVDAALNEMLAHKNSNKHSVLFSNFYANDVPQVNEFGFDKMFVSENEYFEKFGLNFVTPKMFIFEKGKVASWKDY